MSFFEPPPRPMHADEERHVPPPWFQPPEDVLAGLVPDRRVLAMSRPVLFLLSHIDAYPTGCRFNLQVLAHRTDDTSEDAWWDLHDLLFDRAHRRRRSHGGSLPETFARFGVQYADGTKATTTGGPRMPHEPHPPDGPVLQDQGGGGGGGDRHIVMDRPLWLWPLPPAEAFDLVLEWPAVDIGLTRVEIDGSAINEAARTCRPLFADGES